MAGFKQPDFIERQEAAAEARKVALEKFRAKAADPAFAKRLTAQAARAAERSAIKTTREMERVEKEVRDAERARQAERDVAIEAERTKAESAERERALQAEQKAARDARYAARKSRPKRRRVRLLHGTCTRLDTPKWRLISSRISGRTKTSRSDRLFPLVACCLTFPSETCGDEARKIFYREHLRADKKPRYTQPRDRS